MTREEAKYFWPIIKAYSEGKDIQYLLSNGRWVDIADDFVFNNNHKRCRIKQEPKYRPFRDKDECWSEIQKHLPIGWLIGKSTGTPTFMQFSLNNLLFIYDAQFTYEEAMRAFTFADGTPFGFTED